MTPVMWESFQIVICFWCLEEATDDAFDVSTANVATLLLHALCFLIESLNLLELHGSGRIHVLAADMYKSVKI